MENTVPNSSCRKLYRVSCSATAVADTVTEPTESTAGVFKVSDALQGQTLVAAQAGVSVSVKIVPGRTTATGSYTLTVYGYFPCTATSVADNLAALWRPVPLFQATVAATFTPAGDAMTGVQNANDKLALTLTEVAGAAAGATQVTSFGGSVGPAHAVIDTRGSPYLFFSSAEALAFVLVGGLS